MDVNPLNAVSFTRQGWIMKPFGGNAIRCNFVKGLHV